MSPNVSVTTIPPYDGWDGEKTLWSWTVPYHTFIVLSAVCFLLQIVGMVCLGLDVTNRPQNLFLISFTGVEMLTLILFYIVLPYPPGDPRTANVDVALVVLQVALITNFICITLDRVACVLYSIRYNLILTWRKICFMLCVAWLIPMLHVVLLVTPSVEPLGGFQHVSGITYVIWDSTFIFIAICSYTYITRKMLLNNNIASMGSASNRRQMKLRPVIVMSITYLLLVFLPNVLIMLDVVPGTEWMVVMFVLNLTLDPITYIFLLPRVRKRLRKLVPCQTTSVGSADNAFSQTTNTAPE